MPFVHLSFDVLLFIPLHQKPADFLPNIGTHKYEESICKVPLVIHLFATQILSFIRVLFTFTSPYPDLNHQPDKGLKMSRFNKPLPPIMEVSFAEGSGDYRPLKQASNKRRTKIASSK